MMNRSACPQIRLVLTALLLASVLPAVSQDSFYKEERGLFSTRPGATTSLNTIKRLGPVGMGLDLIQPAFTMRILNVEAGSPAEQARLRPGQIIESINGERLADIDPRIQLAKIITEAEASDGVLKFLVADEVGGKAEAVVVTIPVLGAYSETWPLDCPKSDRIVRQAADYLARPDANRGIADVGMLFLLSTGEERDLAVVREWARTVRAHTYPWYLGLGGIPLCECYLRTGDPEILSNIQQWVDSAVASQYNDAWAGRGGVLTNYGNGHLNAAGTAVVTFLLLAKECGADVPDHALLGALKHFFRYAGRGGNPYGDNRPELGFVDNGKNGNLAFAMAAAAALTPEGEESLYAAARDVCAMTSFYTTSFMLHGHTGGGIGEIWRSAAMGLLHEKKPAQYREFMDNRQWHYELSRRYDGSFGILGGGGYDDPKWGAAYPLAYTVPRKTLRITGAPRSKFSKPYQLPAQLWGTEADNAFVSLEPVHDAEGRWQDLSGETLAEDSSMHFLARFHGDEQPSDDEIRRYLHHPDHNIRFVAASKAVGVNSGYIGWRSPGGRARPALMMEFLRAKDPRVRRAMFAALAEVLEREKRTELLTRDLFDLAVQAVRDKAESWWVKDGALHVMAAAPADWLEPHVDLLLPFLQHEDWWLQNAALQALTPVVADERCYRRVLPAIGDLITSNQRVALTWGLLPGIRARIRDAGPAVQGLATATLKESYTDYAGVRTAPGGQDVTTTFEFHLEAIASSLADVPGGLDVLYEVARQRFPQEILPYKEFFLNADPGQFGPKLKEAIRPIIRDELIPEFVGRNRERLRALAAGEVQSGYPGGSRDAIDGLAELYARAGEEEFGWRMFADLRDAEWSYHSFDPIPSEQVPFDQLITRYREVTLPKGMEEWYAPGFDPTRAGWLTGRSPFGHYQGKLPTGPIHKCGAGCTGPGCYGGTTINTLWEKEVLLLRGTFELPPLTEGHRYRLRVNDGDHVGSGGGHIIYVNGRPLIETETCGGRGSGGLPKGAYLTKEFFDDFRTGTVTIAAKTFLRFNDKYKVKPTERIPQGKFSLHLEEQKLPPMGDELVIQSAAVVPMLSSEWQAVQHLEERDKPEGDARFRWNGEFVPNPAVLGNWEVVAQVAAIADFDPAKRMSRGRPPFGSLVLRDGGRTGESTWVWSGDVLMDLANYQALKMVVRRVGDADYLFVEAGGFSTRQKPDWTSPWLVLRAL